MKPDRRQLETVTDDDEEIAKHKRDIAQKHLEKLAASGEDVSDEASSKRMSIRFEIFC